MCFDHSGEMRLGRKPKAPSRVCGFPVVTNTLAIGHPLRQEQQRTALDWPASWLCLPWCDNCASEARQDVSMVPQRVCKTLVMRVVQLQERQPVTVSAACLIWFFVCLFVLGLGE